MLPTPSTSPWFEQGSSFISLEDIMVGVQFTPRQRAFMVLRLAETHSAVQVQQESRRRFGYYVTKEGQKRYHKLNIKKV